MNLIFSLASGMSEDIINVMCGILSRDSSLIIINVLFISQEGIY